ncbi:MAG: exo-alpha-sialidase [Clostridia bacterium]|nr:exo-alpha-sialidase [Clostridia bacterium]
MKKVGKEVLFLATKENNPRNGEGTFLRLRDGRIMFAYSKYKGNSWGDDCMADIAAIFSDDGGETWKDERIIVEHTDYAINCMCPSLIRLSNGDVGLLVLRKTVETRCSILEFFRSSDECESWDGSVCVNLEEEDYYVIENDHLLMTENGRIIIPANIHRNIKKDGEFVSFNYHGKMVFYASDDDGRSWYQISDVYDLPYPEISRTGLQETTLYERKDGTLVSYSRTDLLCQYESTSADGGKTWSSPVPNPFFSSPDSPLLVRRIKDGMIAAVFNPIPKYTTCRSKSNHPDDKANWGRTPLVLALSLDDGKSFTKVYYLEDDPDNGYCYPCILDCGEYLLIGYYHSNNTGVPLNSTKIVKIYYSELD